MRPLSTQTKHFDHKRNENKSERLIELKLKKTYGTIKHK